jgi:hypothetical protein
MRLHGRVAAILSVVVLLFAEAGMAGVIVIDAKAGSKPQSKEADNTGRVKADSRREVGLTLPASAVIMNVEDEEGFFPQHGDDSLLEGKARESRESAKGRVTNGVAVPDSEMSSSEMAVHEGASGNVSKARAYMKNSTSQRVAELPVVSCDNVNNVTGRIGDDSQSGSIITILVNGKQVKARCK